MKLIIDIDDKCFDFISQFGIKDTTEIENIIANGTPLEEEIEKINCCSTCTHKGYDCDNNFWINCEQYDKELE